jgi:molecular chaperone GrpE
MSDAMSNENENAEVPEDQDPQEHIETAVLPEDAVEAFAEGSLESALAAARAALEESQNNHLRLAAELDNVRKRNARELEKARNFGVEGLAGELLSVADSLEMALATGADAPPETLLEGGRNTLKQLQSAMEKYGVTELYPEGEPFDPAFHEAMTMQPSDTAEPDTVLTVVQRGYQLNGRLLRPARVIVAKAP